MKKRDFLSQLESALENKMSAQEIKKQIEYYDSYIADEMRKGQSEEAVIASLGDPWAIAKTLLISAEMGGNEYQSYSKEAAPNYDDESKQIVRRNNWNKIIAIVVIVAIIAVILSIVFGILAFVVRYAVPIIIIATIIYLFKKK